MTEPPAPPGPPGGTPPGGQSPWDPPSHPPPRGPRRHEAPPDAPPVPVPSPVPAQPSPPPGQSPYGHRPPPAPEPPAPGYGPQGGYGQFTFPQMPKAKVEPLAVAGLVTAVLGLPGLILGLLALPRVRGGRRRSPALAWSAVIVSALFTIGWILTIITLALTGTFDRLTEQPEAGDVTEPRTIASATLAEGNCILNLPPDRPVGDVRVVPCEQSHIAQVISAHVLDGSYPGAQALEEQAHDTCTEDVTALPTGEVQVSPWYLIPSEEGWQEGNTRVLCLARGAAGPFEGDLLNQ
mgnify:CR=1 FL=1